MGVEAVQSTSNTVVEQQPLRQTTEIALGPRFVVGVPIVKIFASKKGHFHCVRSFTKAGWKLWRS